MSQSTKYGMEAPSNLLKKYPPTKSSFKNNVNIRIKSFHEYQMRMHALGS